LGNLAITQAVAGRQFQRESTAMRYIVNTDLLAHAQTALGGRDRLYWVVGGAGAGKTTVCRALAARYTLSLYDMDAQIYGAYHQRFTLEQHPVNHAWSRAPNGLAWLLDQSWEEFDAFNQAALPEYLDLLAEDLAATDLHASVVIDGGLANPGLLAQVIPPRQIVCLAAPNRSSAEVWDSPGERAAMKEAVWQLASPQAAWDKFLHFDAQITRTILKECQEHQIAVYSRHGGETLDAVAERVAQILGIGKTPHQATGDTS
jgi:hypothetical protein